jgi:VWFA-related protein
MKDVLLGPAIAALLFAPSARAQQATFRAAVDSVSVDVSVHQQGRAVTDLTDRDFELLDNGVVQKNVSVSREPLPIDVTLVIDLSHSVGGSLFQALERGTAALRARLRASDRVRVVTFNERVRVRGMLERPEAELRLGQPGGLTSLFDATVVALITEPRPERRRMAILFTDGGDVTSFQDGPMLLEVAQRSDMAVFIVALAAGFGSLVIPPGEQPLFEELADRTGGVATVLNTNENLADPFVRALEDFRTSYVLRYTYGGPLAAGWHTLQVRITRRGEFTVRARQGYFATRP